VQRNPVLIQHFQDMVDQGDRVTKTGRPIPGGVVYDDTELSEWITSCITLVSSIFGEDSVVLQQLREYAQDKTVDRRIAKCWGAIKSARASYERGYAAKLESIVKAELYDGVLDQAQGLLDRQYKDVACVLARVSLENALKDLCYRYKLAFGKLDNMNSDLAKAGAYNKTQQKFVTAWAGRGNDAAHGDWTAYDDADVQDLINGVRQFIATYL
jgi:hypothetical protein